MFMINFADAGLIIVYTAVCQGTVALCHIYHPDTVGEAADT